eukprot:jgi/Psemu1/300706/fgenesh1_kg.16_\
MGYNQEISIKQSTHSDIQNRILTVEMKIAENPAAEEGLKAIIAKHELGKTEVESQIKGLEEKIADVRAEIDGQNEALKTIDEEEEALAAAEAALVAARAAAPEPESVEPLQKKIKLDDTPQVPVLVSVQEEPQSATDYDLPAEDHHPQQQQQQVDQSSDQQAEV